MSESSPKSDHPTLAEAQRLILAHIHATESQTQPLDQAEGRIAATTLAAPLPVPAFARSAMDGFAVRSRDLAGATPAAPAQLPVKGEIAAGTTDIRRLDPGQARRIMTGGAIPPGADQVVPQERCREEGGILFIPNPGRPGLHIRAKGTDCAKGQAIVRAGRRIAPEHLPLLAEAGLDQIPTHRPPRVGILCTGSELLAPGATPLDGQIIGGNRFLLAALIRRAGGETVDLGLVADRRDATLAALAEADLAGLDLLITTGGMGPGKYDLMETVLARREARVFYRALRVRPGKATVFALLGPTPLFALPGPPPAVRILFNETVAPALAKAQGLTRPLPKPLRARLTAPLFLRKAGMLNLKGGVLAWSRNGLTVRPAARAEPISAVILIPPHRRRIAVGETVTIHPVTI